MAGLESMYDDDVAFGGLEEEDSFGYGRQPEVRMRTRRRVQQFEEDEDEDGEEEEEDEDPYAQFNLKRLHQKTNSPPPSEEVENYVKLGMGVSGLVLENVICHPFMVLRRTCQVSPADSVKFHCLPFRLLPVSLHLYQRQGLSAFYKGLSGCLTVRGLQMAAEDMVSKLTPWPKELDKTHRTSLRRIGQHLALKATSVAMTTPFYSASLVETVQSDIACEKPGVFDIFREGLFRLAPNYSGGRLLPIYLLLPPTVCHGMAHYVVSSGVSAVTFKMMNRRQDSQDKAAVTQVRNEQFSNALGHFLADALLYPVETVLHRLHLQGSRTIIDDLDCGTAVVPVMTRYEGFFDCLETIRGEEGVWGFYRGFGGMLLQYAVRLAAVHALSLVAKELANLIMDPPPPVVMAPSTKSRQSASVVGGASSSSQPTHGQRFVSQQSSYEGGHYATEGHDSRFPQHSSSHFRENAYDSRQDPMFDRQSEYSMHQRPQTQPFGQSQQFGHQGFQSNDRSSPFNNGSFSDPASPQRSSHQYRF